ncbi:hypothetical protein OROGR_000431 [Orobanche gracilis]
MSGAVSKSCADAQLHQCSITMEHRQLLPPQKGCVIWITGLSGSGRHQLTYALSSCLHSGVVTYVLDEHNIRHSLCRDLGFGIDQSVEYLRRVGEVAKLFADAGVICITNIESPYNKDREACRALLPRGRFIEVFMDVPLQPCEGRTKGFTGIDDLYCEPPLSCEIILKHQGSSQSSLSEMAEEVVSYLVDHGYLNDDDGSFRIEDIEANISKMPQICYASESLEKLHQYMGYWYLKSDLVGVIVSQKKYCIPVPNQMTHPDDPSDAFDCFCEGVSHYGPFWDHSLSYWYASLKEPQKVLFMKYEDMQSRPEESLKLLAHFVGHPFTKEEEENGALERVIRLCSFDNMSTLEVNRGEETKPIGAQFTVANNMFFRKGKVGDYKAHLTPDMINRLEAITLKRCEGSGLMLL